VHYVIMKPFSGMDCITRSGVVESDIDLIEKESARDSRRAAIPRDAP